MPVDTAACPVDLEDGLARAGDDREFYKELLEIFLDDAPLRMTELREALVEKDAEKASRAAHSIKGAAANMSALDVQAEAKKIEEFARAGSLEQAAEFADSLQAELDRLSSFAESF